MDWNFNDHAMEVLEHGSIKNTKIRLNVGGKTFVTFKSTLQSIPDSRLCSLRPDSIHYDPDNEEYFFDRNPVLFPSILDAYRTGQLHFPHSICAPVFKQELDFWGLPESRIATCCWKTYLEYEHDRQALCKLEDAIQSLKRLADQYREKAGASSLARTRLKIWAFLEDPSSSSAAMAWSVIYLLLLLASVVTMVLETHPRFRRENPPMWAPCNNVSSMDNPKMIMYCTTIAFNAIRYLNHFCNFTILVELLIRFAVWPSPLRFICYMFNVIDLISVLPVTIMSTVTLISPQYWAQHSNPYVVYIVVSVTGVMRSVRILKVIKHNNGLRVMLLAMMASAREILLLLLLMSIGMLIFATMMYFVEFHEPHGQFGNIPVGFWWSLITMTTIGYGDMVPVTVQGQLVGAACAVTGILAMALPIPVIANNFNTYYNFAKLRDSIIQRDKSDKDAKLTHNEVYKTVCSDDPEQL